MILDFRFSIFDSLGKRLRRLIEIAAVGVLCLGLGGRAVAAPTDAQVAARKTALDIAGAFSNDGFKLRDGHWFGVLRPSEHALIQVNLYAGNQYWFSVGATDGAKKIAIAIFDETGRPVHSEPYQEGPKAAAGFSPSASGPYFVRIEELEGEPATFCLLYSYK
jgi:hypothetical protein